MEMRSPWILIFGEEGEERRGGVQENRKIVYVIWYEGIKLGIYNDDLL